jgi:hypothetical protein
MAQLISILVLVITLVSIVAFILETMPELNDVVPHDVWFYGELSCTLVFSIEYICRLSVSSINALAWGEVQLSDAWEKALDEQIGKVQAAQKRDASVYVIDASGRDLGYNQGRGKLSSVPEPEHFPLEVRQADRSWKLVWKFVRSPMNLTDLAAILPFYLYVAVSSMSWAKALGILRCVRIVRLFRIFKLNKYSSGLQLMIIALRGSSQALWVLFFFLFIGIVLFSSAIYYIERFACPDRETLLSAAYGDGSNRTEWDKYMDECYANSLTRVSPSFGICCDEYGSALDFPSIVHAAWWAVVTMTTVGFGDLIPRTYPGRAIGTCTMLSGILLIALPIAIIGQKFQEAYEEHEHNKNEPGAPSPSSSSRSGRSKAQFLREAQKRDGPVENNAPSFSDMSRRLRLMRLPQPVRGQNLGMLARDLADDFDEAGAMQKEIVSMQSFEDLYQCDIVHHFDTVLTELCRLCALGSADGPARADPERRPGMNEASASCGGLVQQAASSSTSSIPGPVASVPDPPDAPVAPAPVVPFAGARGAASSTDDAARTAG